MNQWQEVHLTRRFLQVTGWGMDTSGFVCTMISGDGSVRSTFLSRYGKHHYMLQNSGQFCAAVLPFAFCTVWFIVPYRGNFRYG